MDQSSDYDSSLFQTFPAKVDHIGLPEKFTYPFYYEPHPLCLLAAEELKKYVSNHPKYHKLFDMSKGEKNVLAGKMFGVLLVQNLDGEVGYLQAFSGKLNDRVIWPDFVPPVVNILEVDSFYKLGEKAIMEISRKIRSLESDDDYLSKFSLLETERQQAQTELNEQKQQIKADKKKRQAIRQESKPLMTDDEFEILNERLKQESTNAHYAQKDLSKYWRNKIEISQAQLVEIEEQIASLKTKRKQMSIDLQKQIFDKYQFFNQSKKQKSLLDIFNELNIEIPPSGAGECAGPKLLQYAFRHDLKPLAMAEFWWGKSPSSDIRKHGYFYPSCKGKCYPILGHMLEGMTLDESPMMANLNRNDKIIETLYEDEHLVVINKPAGLLSVPGKTISDSVAQRMSERFPHATGPIIVHRLDSLTSGIMLIAKTKDVHKGLQQQFLSRSIKKHYVAVLEGDLQSSSGEIDLPLRVDLEDRPRQLVCFEHGKPAITKYEIVEKYNGWTRVNFYPVTGRTHQLRVHAAHVDGLNMPIVGDDLYGRKNKRLHLHAASISFTHPVLMKEMHFECKADF